MAQQKSEERDMLRATCCALCGVPNYVAVVAEGLALPLVHTAWLTAIGFTLANALLLSVRIRVENTALGYR